MPWLYRNTCVHPHTCVCLRFIFKYMLYGEELFCFCFCLGFYHSEYTVHIKVHSMGFDKCKLSCSRHYGITQSIFLTGTSSVLCLVALLSPNPWQPLMFLLSRCITCLIWHVILSYSLFYCWMGDDSSSLKDWKHIHFFSISLGWWVASFSPCGSTLRPLVLWQELSSSLLCRSLRTPFPSYQVLCLIWTLLTPTDILTDFYALY